MIGFLLLAVSGAAGAYQLLAAAASVRHLRRKDPEASALPPVSILKPVRGADPHFFDCIRSHAEQDYPEYEVLFGIADAADPAVAAIERLRAGFPACAIRVVVSRTPAPNAKVGVLADLAAEARYPVLVVNDGDIRVPRDYLRRVVAPLEDPRVGMVTCLYRARAESWPGRLEALGIATDFAPSVLVAPLAGVSEFALGATMVFRSSDLERIGGFRAVAEYLADDYQLGRLISGLGLRIAISRCVVETELGAPSWGDVWRHQARWARTIRVSRGGGYAGLPLTNATLWSILLAGTGRWRAAGALMAARAAGAVAGALAVGDRTALRDAWLVPVRDLGGLAVWMAGLTGRKARWREFEIELGRDGRILRTSRSC